MKFTVRATLLALALVAAPAAAGDVDVSAYVKVDRFDDLKISPNGDYLAATVRIDNRANLLVMRRSDNQITANLTGGPNTLVWDFWWVNPERVLATLAEKVGALDQPRLLGELYGTNANGSKREMLVGQRVTEGLGSNIKTKKAERIWADLVDTLPADDKSVVIAVGAFSADPFTRAERMDVYNGRRATVARAPLRNAGFATDNRGVVRFAFGAGTDLRDKLYYRSGDGAEWQLINDENVTRRSERPIGFSADDRIAYLQVGQDRGPDAIVAYDVASGTRTQVLRDEVADPARIIYRNGTSIPVGAFFEAGIPRTAFFDATSLEARTYRSLEAAFGGPVRITSQTADGREALVEVWSDRNPGDFYLFDTQSKKAQHVLSRRDWFDPERLSPTKPIKLTARDGLPLHGYLTTPKGADGRKLPTVVMPHGGPFGVRDQWAFDPEVQMLADAGYAVLQVNYRGSGGYGEAFVAAGKREWGGTMQDDVTDATRWAVQQGVADPARICIYGASYGGYAALMGAAKEPDLYKCAAGYVGVYDLPMMHTTGDIQERGSGETYLREWLGPKDKLDAVSPTRMANRIKVPVFLAAGGEDERAPIQHTRMMEQALREAGVPVETLYYDTEGHGFYRPERRQEFYSRLLAFLSRSLGGSVAASGGGGDKTAK